MSELKIFDFNDKTDPTGLVGRHMELGWPCAIYRVTLPKTSDSDRSEFNAFERCMLKLIANGCFDPADLAKVTCLTPDFIEIVLLKLQDRAKINSRYQLFPSVRQKLEKLDAEIESAPTEYETCAIFRECVGGTLLPMLVDAKLRSEEINDDHTVGRRHVGIRSLEATKVEPLTPTSREVLSALRTMARRRRAAGATYRIPPAECMSIASESEQCWIRVRIVMQQTGAWRVLNPFGVGWSPELEMAYQELLKRENTAEVREFKAWQHRNADVEGVQGLKSASGNHEPFETLENISHYPELIDTLKRKRFDVYAAIEWALFYALGQADVKKIIQLLGIITREESLKKLREARDYWYKKNKTMATQAKRTADRSCDITTEDERAREGELEKRERMDDELVKGLCSIPSEGELRYFMDGAAKMQTVLPLAILMSVYDSSFVFNRLAENCCRFLPIIAELKDRRDSKRHGKVVWSEIYGEDDMQFMRTVVETLLPSVRFSEDTTIINRNCNREETADDARISARVALQDAFGVLSFMRMDARLQDSLINAEMFRRGHETVKEMVDALDCVNDLYAATQCALRPLLVGARPNSATIENAARRAKDAGFGPLPPSMATVRDSMLCRTLDGDDQTLQACAVAWLLLADEDFLRHVALNMPGILAEIDRLITVDGHGNQRIPMRSADMDLLCRNVYNVIKTLTEV